MLTGPFNLSQTRELLEEISHSPKKWLGQNFLIDGNVVRKSLALAEACRHDTIIEVGPGLGTLTTALLQTGARVFAVERDATLAAHLRTRVVPKYPETFDLKEGDAMKFPLGNFSADTPFKIVANLPYAISTPWMDAVLDGKNLPETLVLMLQKEAADRFTGTHGTKNYGALSIFLEAVYERAPGHKVSANCFFPPPKVDSYLLHLRLRKNPQKFSVPVKKLIRELFIYRRKQTASILRKIASDVPAEIQKNWLESLAQFGCEPADRPENIPLPAWLELEKIMNHKS